MSLYKADPGLHVFLSGGVAGRGGGDSAGLSTNASPTHAGWDRAGSKSSDGFISVLTYNNEIACISNGW